MEKDYQVGKGKIELRNGSITRYKADALVCPNIPELEMVAIPGGCQFAFFAEGGEEIFLEARKIAERNGQQPIGSAHLTTAGRLPAKYVVHSVGPHTSNEIMRNSTKNVLELIASKGLSSVGFPTLGTGLYGFPLDEAVDIMSDEFSDYLKANNSLQRVGLVLYGADSYRTGQKILDAKFR